MKKCLIEDEHERQAKTIERCVLCNAKIGISFEERLRIKVKAIPLENRQKFLDGMHSGLNLGESARAAGIEETLVASQILMDNIDSYEFIRKEAV